MFQGGSGKGEARIQFMFDEPLARRFREVSRHHLNRSLAIVIDNRIVSAPVLRAEVSNSIVLTGRLTRQELQPLFDALDGTLHAASGVVEEAVTAGNSLEGIWRTVSVRLQGNQQEDLGTARVFGFHRGQVYTAHPQGPVHRGPDYLVNADRYEGIDLVDQQSQRTLRGIYRFLSDGRLELTLDEEERPQQFDPEGPHEIGTLERLGSFPPTADETRALLQGLDSGTAQSLAVMLSMAQLPTEVKAEVDQPARAAARTSGAVNNLRILGLGFINFHDTFGKFPASSNRLEGARRRGGEPIQPFSWRVAILPFIEQNQMYEQYRFDEPWDSEHNLTLLPKMPDVYRSPLAGDDQPTGETNYQGFVGPRTALGPDEGISFAQITDGTANTLVVVETSATVPWTKPQDLAFEKPEDARQAVPFDGQPLHYLTADGVFHSMDPTDWEELAKLIIAERRHWLTP